MVNRHGRTRLGWAGWALLASLACAGGEGAGGEGARDDGGPPPPDSASSPRPPLPRDAGPSDAPARPDAGLEASDGSAPGRDPETYFDPSAPADAPARLEGAASSERAPEVVYPADGTLLPPNLPDLEVHFRAASHTLFELQVVQDGAVRLRLYTGCPRPIGEGCVQTIPAEVWEALRLTRARGAYALRVRGVGGDGERVGVSEPISIELADEAVEGAVYFWTTDPPSIRRYDFDLGRASSEPFLDEDDTGGRCVGCHALSRDGSRIAVGLGGPGSYGVFDVASRREGPTRDGQLFSFDPTGEALVVGGAFFAKPMQIVSATTGAVLARLDEPGQAPDWSPDGERIAFASVYGDVTVLRREGASWARAETISDLRGARYPAYSPDGRWLVFRSGGAATGAGIGGVLRVHDVEAGETSRLAASVGDDTWPKWNPGVYRHEGRALFWMSFSSGRDFGLRSNGGDHQIWMVAFAPGEGAASSWEAFRLPAQEWGVGNFIPQWALETPRAPCEADDECVNGEVCIDGACVPPLDER